MEKQFVRMNQVIIMIGLSRSTIYNMMNQGDFPKGRLISARARGWLRSDIDSWMNSRIS